MDEAAIGLHDLLVAATDDNLDSALDRFIAVSRNHVGFPVGVVLHPSLGGATYISGDASTDLLDVATYRDQSRATVWPIDAVSGGLFGWLVVDSVSLDAAQSMLAERLSRLLAGTLTRITASRLDPAADCRDALTGLANRAALESALWAAAQARSLPWTLLVVEIEGLDVIESTYSADVQDDVVVALSDRLRGLIRGGDLAARLDLSRFGVLVNAAGDEITRLADRVGQTLSGPVATSTGTLEVAIDVTCTTAHRADEVLRLIQSAVDGK